MLDYIYSAFLTFESWQLHTIYFQYVGLDKNSRNIQQSFIIFHFIFFPSTFPP